MIPISAVVGVSTIGYLLDQVFRENEFNASNKRNKIPVSNIDGCAEQYPWNFIETFDDLNKETNAFVPNNKISSDDIQSQNLETSFLTPQHINSPSNITALNKSGNPPADYLINATKRPVEDFLVNNMVPFFKGNGTNQDMRGTGVSQANVNSDNFNLGNNFSSPNYHTLATFTGNDDTYLHKREAPSFFSPLEQRNRNTIPGEDPSGQRPLRDRYTTSILTKNDQKPFESIQVGPGINIDGDLPNDGQGFNSGLTTKIRPNNVNAYRLTQLPGRIAGTKYQASNLPEALPGNGPSFKSFLNSKTNHNSSNNGNIETFLNGNIDTQKLIDEGSMYGVPNKKQPLSSISTQQWRPMTATPAITQAPMNYSNYILPSGTDKRTTTNVEFGQSIRTN